MLVVQEVQEGNTKTSCTTVESGLFLKLVNSVIPLFRQGGRMSCGEHFYEYGSSESESEDSWQSIQGDDSQNDAMVSESEDSSDDPEDQLDFKEESGRPSTASPTRSMSTSSGTQASQEETSPRLPNLSRQAVSRKGRVITKE